MKKLLQTTAFLTVLLLVASCAKEISPQVSSDLSTDVIVKDKSGNNLLGTSSAASYKFEDIRLYNVENGSRTELINSGSIRYFEMTKDASGQTILRINPAFGKDKKSAMTAIQWRTNDEDVIEARTATDSQPAHTSCNGKATQQSKDPAARRVVEIIK